MILEEVKCCLPAAVKLHLSDQGIESVTGATEGADHYTVIHKASSQPGFVWCTVVIRCNTGRSGWNGGRNTRGNVGTSNSKTESVSNSTKYGFSKQPPGSLVSS